MRIVHAGPSLLLLGEKAPGPGVESPLLGEKRGALPIGCRGDAGITTARLGTRRGASALTASRPGLPRGPVPMTTFALEGRTIAREGATSKSPGPGPPSCGDLWKRGSRPKAPLLGRRGDAPEL
jgi:hypothetical protein